MAQDPDIKATDDDGNELQGANVLVNGIKPGSGGGDVASVFGRTGDVTAKDGDYTASQIANVDVAALLEGNDTDKPAAGTAGRYYFATDTTILYRDNGTSWVAQSGRGTSANPLPDQHVQSLSADNLSHAGVGMTAILSADQTISNTTVTKVQIDSSLNDDDNELDSTNYQIDVADTGKYLVSPVVSWNSDTGWSTGDTIFIYIYVNGSRKTQFTFQKVSTGSEAFLHPDTKLNLSSGDVIDIRTYQDSGAGKTLGGGTTFSTGVAFAQVG